MIIIIANQNCQLTTVCLSAWLCTILLFHNRLIELCVCLIAIMMMIIIMMINMHYMTSVRTKDKTYTKIEFNRETLFQSDNQSTTTKSLFGTSTVSHCWVRQLFEIGVCVWSRTGQLNCPIMKWMRLTIEVTHRRPRNRSRHMAARHTRRRHRVPIGVAFN